MGAAVVVVGSAHTDLVASAHRLPVRGETLPGNRFAIHPGGKGGNQAAAAALAGASTALIARVGDDLFGAQLRDRLQAKGVDTSHVSTDPVLPTGASTVLTGEGGDYASIIVPAAADNLGPAEIQVAAPLIEGSSVLLLQMEIPLERSAEAAALACSSGGTRKPVVVLNIAPVRERERLAITLKGMLDILVVNAVEAGMLVDASVDDVPSAEQAAESLRSLMDVDTVIVTLGGDGLVMQQRQEWLVLPAWPVTVVDTIGAGDAFVGALAAELARGAALDAATRFANAAGALAVTVAGGHDALPTRQAILDFLRTAEG